MTVQGKTHIFKGLNSETQCPQNGIKFQFLPKFFGAHEIILSGIESLN